MITVKESSDELNPAEVLPVAVIENPPRRVTARDTLALAIATCGVGYAPIAPGTWGSAVGVGLYLLARAASWQITVYASAHGLSVTPLESFRTSLVLIFLIALTAVGIWAATRAEPLLGRKDPGPVVIDEVVGQLITFLFVPFNAGWRVVIVGFLMFRLFDIWKPYPIRRLEALESGLGIMADDVLAGIYAAIVMSLLTSFYLLF